MINITSILSGKESVTIEAKLALGGLPNSIWESYSSFANTFGGVILLGVEENKETHALVARGVEDPHQLITNIWNMLNNSQKINNNILLDNHIYATEYQGTQLVVMEVPRASRREKPVYIGSDPFRGTFRRNHEGDYHCSREEVLAMMRDQAIESADSKILENMELSDLNSESVSRYRIMFNNKKPGHVWTNLRDEEFLLKIGAAGKGEDKRLHPTLAGLIFFGDFMNIVNELPNYFLDYRERLSTDTRWSDRVNSGDGNWSGNIFDFYFKIIDRLISDVKKPFKLDKNLLRVDDTSVHAGLRESLANALIHADYYGRCGIVIDKKFREVSISNPGLFRIGIDEAIAGGISDARNSRLFNMFSLIEVGERSGSGLCDIFHTWNENGYKRPSITETLNPDRITFALQIEIDSNESNRDSNDLKSDSNEQSHDSNLNENEMRVFDALCRNNGLSAGQVAAQTGLSVSTVNRIYKSLKAKSYIMRSGKTRGKWIILK